MQKNVLQDFLDERISSLYKSIPIFNQFTGLLISVKVVTDFFLYKLFDKLFNYLILCSFLWICFALMLSFFFNLITTKQIILLKISLTELLLKSSYQAENTFLIDKEKIDWKVKVETVVVKATTRMIFMLIISFLTCGISTTLLISLLE